MNIAINYGLTCTMTYSKEYGWRTVMGKNFETSTTTEMSYLLIHRIFVVPEKAEVLDISLFEKIKNQIAIDIIVPDPNALAYFCIMSDRVFDHFCRNNGMISVDRSRQNMKNGLVGKILDMWMYIEIPGSKDGNINFSPSIKGKELVVGVVDAQGTVLNVSVVKIELDHYCIKTEITNG